MCVCVCIHVCAFLPCMVGILAPHMPKKVHIHVDMPINPPPACMHTHHPPTKPMLFGEHPSCYRLRAHPHSPTWTHFPTNTHKRMSTCTPTHPTHVPHTCCIYKRSPCMYYTGAWKCPCLPTCLTFLLDQLALHCSARV